MVDTKSVLKSFALFFALTFWMGSALAAGDKALLAGDKALSAAQYAKAASLFTKAIKGNLSDKKLAQAFLRRGTAHFMLSKHTAAISDFSSSLGLGNLKVKEKKYAYYYRGKAYQAVGLNQLAQQDLTRSGRVKATKAPREVQKTASISSAASVGKPQAPAKATPKKSGGFFSGWFGQPPQQTNNQPWDNKVFE